MAYAERRGKGPKAWRVKYKRPDGTEGSESGFETKAAALRWGRGQEASISAGRWTDPNAGKILVSAWVESWRDAQDVGVSTTDTRGYLLRRFILPGWGSRELGSLGAEEISRWEKALPARAGVSRRTAADARSLLCTVLGDAVNGKLIPYNPALRPRNRGRRTGRKLERSPQRAWVTPLQTLLLAERAALVSGRASDFTLIITIGYTGMRWGETIGLQRDYLRQTAVHVEWQLREINGTFHRIPPKDDSYRSPKWQPCLPVDLPDFLASLLALQATDIARRRCACARAHGGSGRYLFLGPDGGHYRRSNFARRIFRPACDGRYEPAGARLPKLIIVDATVPPGTPIGAWPAAQPVTARDPGYEPPRGRGYRAVPDGASLACWLPIMPSLTPHGLRHSHKTWMTEDGIPEILAEQRLGHEVPGMRGLYTHVSDRMREDLKAALQARWEDSLAARAAICPHSPVPLLDALMAPHREAATQPQARSAVPAAIHRQPVSRSRIKMISQIPPNKGRAAAIGG